MGRDADARARGWHPRIARPGTALAVGLLTLAMLASTAVAGSAAHQFQLSGLAQVGLYLSFGLVGVVVAWHQPRNLIISHHVSIDSSGGLTSLDSPAGSTAWWGAVQAVFFPAVAVCWVAWLIGQVLSYRRSSGERRLQLKWLLSGATAFIVAGIALVWINNPTGLWKVIDVLAAIGVLALPVSIGFGIFRFRLYDIDRIISRTLAYAIVTGALVGVYAGLVLLITQVFGFHTPVAVAASTLAAAALFNPLRHRVQRAVDRRFNRARYDADQTVAAFAGRLQDAVDLGTIRADLLTVVHQALEPTHLTVWTSPPAVTGERPEATASRPG